VGTGGIAVSLQGSSNTFVMSGGSASLTGNAFANGAAAFILAGSAANSFDVSQIRTGWTLLGKIDTSNWTLTGTGTYAGPVIVDGGTLSVNGNLASASSLTVNAGATLGGTGTVGNTTINGGTLAPGNSIGTLTVAGGLVFTAAASYLVEVSPATADRTNVTATATPGGATVRASFGPGTYTPKQSTILNAAGGVGGTFNPLVSSNAPNFKTSLSYDSNNVYLNLTALNFGPGLNINQQNVANALSNAFNAGGVPFAVGSLGPGGLTQISGELASGSQQATFDAMNMFLGLLSDPFVAGRNGGASVGGSSAAPYAEESGSYAYAARKQARDAFAKFPTKADVARNDLICWIRAGACGARH
jgi:autotransporter-associated beta strand protein